MVDSATTFAIPAAISAALKSMEDERDRLLGMTEAARAAEEVMALCAPLMTRQYEWDTSSPITVSACAGIGTFGAVVLAVRPKLASDIVPVLRALRSRGYKISGKPEDDADFGRRIYRMRLDDKLIVVQLWLPQADEAKPGDGCQFVVVGHEQKPVYEMRCADKPVADVEAAS
jgi:hypothetical protein